MFVLSQSENSSKVGRKKRSTLQILAYAGIGVGALASNVALACSAHDQLCSFHGIGRAVNHTVNQNSPTAVYIVSNGSNQTDFDNNVLLPTNVANTVVSGTGFQPQGNRNEPYIAADEQPRHIYPSQYQIDFQNGTAQATHSGDFNGGETVPNATGCTHITGAQCEEVKIIGNLPDYQTEEGFVVKQTNHLYNYFDVANPQVDVTSFGIATGRAYFKNNTHLFGEIKSDDPNNSIQITKPVTQSLSGTGAVGDELTYYIGYDDFDAHAAGVVVHNDQTRRVSSQAYGVQYRHDAEYGGVTQVGYQRKNTYERYDLTYDFAAGTITPSNQRYWSTYSDPYGIKNTDAYNGYLAKKAEDEARQKRIEQSRQNMAWQNTDLGQLSGNLYYTYDESGKAYIQKRAGSDLSLSEKLTYAAGVTKGVLNYFDDNKREVVTNALDTDAALVTGTLETVIETAVDAAIEKAMHPLSTTYNGQFLDKFSGNWSENFDSHYAAWREEDTVKNIAIGAAKEYQTSNVFITDWTTSGLESVALGTFDYAAGKFNGDGKSFGESIENRYSQTQTRYADLYSDLESANESQAIGSKGFQTFELATGIKGAVKLVDEMPSAMKALKNRFDKVLDSNSIGTSVTKGVGKADSAPDFVVSPGGTAFPVPKGATGPTPVVNLAGKRTGDAFTGGSGGANGQVDTMRMMDPTPPRGNSPGYPNGYIKYENKAGQGVDPYTGRTLSNKDSHFPIN